VSAVRLRPAEPGDADALAAIFLDARRTSMPWLARVHGEAETRWWIGAVVLVGQAVLVAERDGRPVGFAAVEGDVLAHLYVAPGAWRSGVGRRLLAAAQAMRPHGLRLRTFARNAPARAFYEWAGFVATEATDGSGNEEREPDVGYVWRPGAAQRLPER